ncbi:hypothetical protein LVB87_05805 [Lysobacter sp. KIS68-7]|uniref:hypothetical protein n=1 Tax=Lysobacter sp. KIS68-7 TaxID=2904252 RepID=UPI001E5A9D63|nr:hypothetical protein [Lysobacter sp. KIS68-7]UHQ20656.1 hypothetical protein LVB87_05805 [Lysobacter sp. KIS68-7]
MQLLYASPSFGFGHTLRTALEGEGIRAFCSEAEDPATTLEEPMSGPQTRVYVAPDDYARAVEVLERMLVDDEPAEITPVAAEPQVPMWAAIVVLVFGIVVAGAIVSQ